MNHPVVRRLPANYHIEVEQGLLKTFGRVMPVLMTLCSVIGVSYLVYVWPLGASEQLLAALSAICFGASIVSTIIFNVPINLATGKWDAEHPLKIGRKPAISGSSFKAFDPGYY